jgi:hypothetical protein
MIDRDVICRWSAVRANQFQLGGGEVIIYDVHQQTLEILVDTVVCRHHRHHSLRNHSYLVVVW